MINPGAALIGTLLNVMALTWILSLERNGCPCANDWRRKVLKYWYFVALVLPVIIMVIKPPAAFSIVMGVFGLVAFYALASSLWSIERNKCGCAQDWREKVLVVMTSLSVVGVAFRLVA